MRGREGVSAIDGDELGDDWRLRLRAAVRVSGLKYSVISYDTGLTPETISRVLTASHQRPSLQTIARLAHAVGTTVGHVLGEEGFPFSGSELRALRAFMEYLEHLEQRRGGFTASESEGPASGGQP